MTLRPAGDAAVAMAQRVRLLLREGQVRAPGRRRAPAARSGGRGDGGRLRRPALASGAACPHQHPRGRPRLGRGDPPGDRGGDRGVPAGTIRPRPGSTRGRCSRSTGCSPRPRRRSGPLTPWHPDNTVAFPPFQSRRARGGRQPGGGGPGHGLRRGEQRAIPGHVAIYQGRGRSPGPAHADLDVHHRPRRGRAAAQRRLLPGARRRLPRPVRPSPRSGGRRSRRNTRGHRDLVVGRMRAVVHTLDGEDDDAPDGIPAEPLPFVREWAELVIRHAERADPIIESGVLASSFHRAAVSEDHAAANTCRLAMSNDEYHGRKGFGNPVFQRYRVVLNYTYSFLTRIGPSCRANAACCATWRPTPSRTCTTCPRSSSCASSSPSIRAPASSPPRNSRDRTRTATRGEPVRGDAMYGAGEEGV